MKKQFIKRKSGINHPLLKIIFSVTLALLVHFREFLPFGMAEILFLIPLGWILLKRNSIDRLSLIYVTLGLLICSIFLLSFIFLGTLGGGAKYIVILFLNFLFFWLVINIKDFDTLSALKTFIVISAVVSGLTIIAFLLFYLGNHSLQGLLYTRGWYARAQGFLENPNYYSISMLFAFYSAYVVWFKRRWGGIYVLIILCGVLVSLSRGAILAIIVFLFIAFIHSKKVRHITYKGFCTISIIGIIGFYSLTNLKLANLWNALFSRFSDGGGGIEYRLAAFQESMNIFFEGNYMIGIGRTNFENLGMNEIVPHNTFVSALIDFGIIGVSSFLLLLAVIFLKAVSAYNKTALPMAIFFSLIVICLTNDYQFVKEWWLAMSLVYVISK